MESIQRIMIRTQICRDCLPSNRAIEHTTECLAIDDSSVNSESDDPPGVVIHNDQHPVRPQCHGLTSEQIDTVKAVLRVTDEGEPGRTAATRRRMIVGSQDPPDHILINRYSKRQLDLVRNARTSPNGIALLHIDNRTN